MSNIGTRLKTMVVGDKKVKFTRYFDGCLWYQTEDGFEFPVDVKEIGTATFLPEDRAILFMRYINKHLKMLDEAAKQPEIVPEGMMVNYGGEIVPHDQWNCPGCPAHD